MHSATDTQAAKPNGTAQAMASMKKFRLFILEEACQTARPECTVCHKIRSRLQHTKDWEIIPSNPWESPHEAWRQEREDEIQRANCFLVVYSKNDRDHQADTKWIISKKPDSKFLGVVFSDSENNGTKHPMDTVYAHSSANGLSDTDLDAIIKRLHEIAEGREAPVTVARTIGHAMEEAQSWLPIPMKLLRNKYFLTVVPVLIAIFALIPLVADTRALYEWARGPAADPIPLHLDVLVPSDPAMVYIATPLSLQSDLPRQGDTLAVQARGHSPDHTLYVLLLGPDNSADLKPWPADSSPGTVIAWGPIEKGTHTALLIETDLEPAAFEPSLLTALAKAPRPPELPDPIQILWEKPTSFEVQTSPLRSRGNAPTVYAQNALYAWAESVSGAIKDSLGEQTRISGMTFAAKQRSTEREPRSAVLAINSAPQHAVQHGDQSSPAGSASVESRTRTE